MSSSDVDRTLRTLWGLTRGARNRRRIQEELADHLREAAADERARGLESEAAERRAVERFGDPRVVARAFPVSRWRWPAAMLALAAMAGLLWAEVTTRQASIRTCLGGRCPTWVPRAPQHPIRERVEALTAVAALVLAVGLAFSAVWRRYQASRAYRWALAGDAEAPPSITTALLLRDAVRAPLRVAGVGLALAVVGGAALTVRWQTEGPPSTGVRVRPFNPAVLALRPVAPTGLRGARPLLRKILSQIPGDFTSVGVHPGRGIVVRTPAWAADVSPTETDPNLILSRFEVMDLVMAYQSRQAGTGMHVIRYDAGFSSGRMGLRPILSGTSIPDLRGHITRKLHRIGLHIESLRITHPYGPLAIAVTRTSDPRRYLEAPPGALNRHITWGALVIEDMTGTVRVVYTTTLGNYRAEEWSDPRLFSAQPYVGGGRIPPPIGPFRPAPRTRVTRT